jgi:hypothetical protein
MLIRPRGGRKRPTLRNDYPSAAKAEFVSKQVRTAGHTPEFSTFSEEAYGISTREAPLDAEFCFYLNGPSGPDTKHQSDDSQTFSEM